MRKLIIFICLMLVVLSAVAFILKPELNAPGKTRVLWATGINPERVEQIKAFNQENSDVEICLDVNNRDSQKILLQSSSGVGPDVFDTANGNFIQFYSVAGITEDITEPAKKMGFSLNDTWPSIYNELTHQDRQISYPANVGVSVLIYNKNIFDRLQVPYPSGDMTWEDFIGLAKKLTSSKGNKPIYGIACGDCEMWDVFFHSLKGEYFSEDGTRLLLNHDSLKKAFQFHKDFIFKHKILPSKMDVNTSLSQGGFGQKNINLFADGRYAMMMVGKWSLIGFRKALKDQRSKLTKYEANPVQGEKPELLRIGAVPLPHFPGMPVSYHVHSRSVAVNAQSPNKEAAMKFLKYLSGPDYSRSINRGVDSLPGNPAYVNEGLETGEPELSELQIHEVTVDGVRHGYQPRNSPFLDTLEVVKILKAKVEILEQSPDATVEGLLNDAQEEMVALMQRNLDRSPNLMKEYQSRTGSVRVAKHTP